jgi:hypothetical protein
MQTMSVAHQELPHAIEAIAASPTPRPKCFLAAESFHQGTDEPKDCSAQAGTLDNTQPER